MGQKWGSMGQIMGQNYCNDLKQKPLKNPLNRGFSGVIFNYLKRFRVIKKCRRCSLN